MQIKTSFTDGVIPDRYSKKTDELVQGCAAVSFPFQVLDLPEACETLAWSLVDYDSIPVCGFAYIHWVVANVPASQTQFEADFSRLDKTHLHGVNSLVSKFLTDDFSLVDHYYIGPYPPDKDHRYTLTVYALDSQLDLPEGFHLNELMHATEGHLLAKAEADFIGKF
ncbi:YbhB/YbcL family Raf kinase inhibitor-like protein [Streptococcus loxodontisalivarius]|uniref:Raf kinase inhibitor-like YbhB/YbcL family protein n=1 Tax=Streptococcus loxodontisalivarius TaxID=1349415 RepID=A0ABS2PP34_9STRE|nr:YbhB/YbcL family Raf kinase inhibitor-like protein [Streptococcus loxodontisalivarius]MBM7641789.1 Raf kinase inhibitor-like YbhB/YbcL family protein [Streptococcus loxodontisalivarius]